MQVEFSRMEKTAGVFVLVAILGATFALVGTAVRKGWFQTKIPYFTLLENRNSFLWVRPLTMNGSLDGARQGD